MSSCDTSLCVNWGSKLLPAMHKQHYNSLNNFKSHECFHVYMILNHI